MQNDTARQDEAELVVQLAAARDELPLLYADCQRDKILIKDHDEAIRVRDLLTDIQQEDVMRCRDQIVSEQTENARLRSQLECAE